MRPSIVSLAALAVVGTTTLCAESPQQAFIKSWEGRTVVVRNTLYTLVYNERGKLGNQRTGKREGLIVATPSQGMYFQFDGRQGRDDVVEHDPQRMVAAVSAAYEPDSLELRSYRKVEPLALNRYDPGVELVVCGVKIDRDTVTIAFAPAGAGRPGDEDTVTSLRIKWPMPLSKALSERDLIEDLIGRFVK
jgi:hypothetical protein